MRSFEEYWNEHGDVYAMEIAEEAWDYQQSKIDELTKQRDSFIKTYEIEIDKSDELQKRVDEQGLIIAKAMSIASDLQKNWEMFEIGKKLEQALKGDQ